MRIFLYMWCLTLSVEQERDEVGAPDPATLSLAESLPLVNRITHPLTQSSVSSSAASEC